MNDARGEVRRGEGKAEDSDVKERRWGIEEEEEVMEYSWHEIAYDSWQEGR